MFKIDSSSKQISLTRGDVASIEVKANNEDGSAYEFKVGDVVRIKVFERKDCGCVVLQKDVLVEEANTSVLINLASEDTRIGEIINKPTKYWYEIELNPETHCQTIVCYDEDGEKVFMLYPEGADRQ
jgi:hypothetical protein